MRSIIATSNVYDDKLGIHWSSGSSIMRSNRFLSMIKFIGEHAFFKKGAGINLMIRMQTWRPSTSNWNLTARCLEQDFH